MGNMNRVALLSALVASGGAMGMSAEVMRKRDDVMPVGVMPTFASHSPGKGKGKRPHHSSARFVAQDKRDARKARNRRRR